jgi:NAD(P)H-dependent FMN reductase
VTAVGKPVLEVVTASTRPGRIGRAFADWFIGVAAGHGAFEVADVDLAVVGLPFLDEPDHPKFGRYVHEHTRQWSATVSRADAFVFVTPEYNYGYSAVLKNALDFLHAEWADKAVGFVGYGGIGAGTRAIQQLKQVVTTLRMVPVFEAVNIPFAVQALDDHGNVLPDENRVLAAVTMLDELARLTGKLRPAANGG